MSVTRRQLYLAAVFGAVAVVVASPVLGSVLSGFIATSGTVPMQTNTDTTVYVSGASDMAGSEFPYDNTVFVATDQGNMTIIGNGQANVSVDASEIEGDLTRVSELDVDATTVTLDPADKSKVAISGAATELAWREPGVDNGQTDFTITGPDGTDSDLTLYALPGDLTITAVDADTGTPLALATTTSNGQATFSIPHSTHSVELVSGDQTKTPTLSNPTPTGDLSTPPTQVSVDVDDPDFPEDEVNVSIDYEGSEIHNETITSASTVTATLPSTPSGGVHSWSVNATDRHGNVELDSYQFSTPSDVYIYNETQNATGERELLDGANITLKATLSGDDAYAEERQITNGVFDLEGLDASQSYVLTLESDDYFTRSIYLPNLYEQRAIFLLNKTQPSTENIVRLDDRTGEFDDNPALQIQRVVNASNLNSVNATGQQWYTIAGDRMGADNELFVYLEQSKRYRFVVTNADGDTRVLGDYVADTNNDIDLEIGSIEYRFGEEETGYEWTADSDNSTGSPFIKFAYNDYSNTTDSVQMEIRYRNNNTVLVSETFRDGPYGEIVYTQPISQTRYNNNDFIVAWEADRGDDAIGSQRAVGGQRLLNFPLSDFWMTASYSLVALLLAFAVGAGISAGAGALAVAGWMGVAWYIGAIPTEIGAGAVVLAFLVAAWTSINEQETEVIQ